MANTFVRWLSTVLALTNSSAAICPIGLPGRDEPGDFELAAAQAEHPTRLASSCPGDAMTETAQLSGRLVGITLGAGRGELRLGPLQLGDGVEPPSGTGEGATRERAGAAGEQVSSRVMLDARGGKGELGGSQRLARRQQQGCPGALPGRHRDRDRRDGGRFGTG